VRASKIKKSYTDYGGNGDVFILLHGFLSSSKYWNKIQPLLSESGVRVITIDLLGFGAAPKPKQSRYDYDAHTQHLDDVLGYLKISTTVTIIGHSMGALVASNFTKQNPGKVQSLILLHPPLYKDILDARNTLRETGRLYRFLLDSKYRHFGWIFMRTFFRYQLGRHTRLSREKSLKNVIEATEIFGELENVDVDTLLLTGSKDRPEYRKNLKNAPMSSRVVLVEEDVSHHSPVKNPAMVYGVIGEFLDRELVKS